MNKRKAITAVLVGLSLVAGQALAQTNGAPRISDRATAGDAATDFFADDFLLKLAAFGLITWAVVEHADDDDDPVSA